MRQRVDQFLIHAVGGAQMKFALHIVEDVDRAGLGVGELHRLGDDGREHGLEIERRVHRLRDFAERTQLLDRVAKFVGALPLRLSSRVFSMAMTACAAKDLISATSFSSKTLCS